MVEVAYESLMEVLPFVVYAIVLFVLFFSMYFVAWAITFVGWIIGSKLTISGNLYIDECENKADIIFAQKVEEMNGGENG